ncbi:MAG: glycosyltransferase family 39 protein [Desulfobacterales bacterium]|nr:glycosyltransferase family 39 protein [Desulfobacterales bacterium]MDD4071190.1 glycosyltransferase family 39 protein [Desulfobacterales bacterium]MDD4392198.1 glycosyltransferase family 39 protein [Desulfobacterales bacterium]
MTGYRVPDDDTYPYRYLPILVFVLGFFIRLYACCFTFIINPDGVLYIHQARALFYGQWDAVTSCGLPDLSVYPILIAGAFALLHDWMAAARGVSLVFGSALLLPVYFTLRRFFDRNVSATATLIFALIPVMVGRSADVLRDPVCWFFLALAIYGFVTYMDRKNSWYLLLSSICFILASWARIESILYAGISFLCMLPVKQDRKLRHLMVFVLPFLCLALVSIIGVTACDMSVNDLHRAKLLANKMFQPFYRYSQLQMELAQLSAGFQDDFMEFFLPEARANLWLVAFGTLLNRVLEAFFYPFALVFGIGLAGIGRRIKTDRRILYLSALTVSAAGLLYLHTLDTWAVYYRFIVIMILPCAVFAGFGIEKIRSAIQHKIRVGEAGALALIVFLILVSGLPKNLYYRGYDKQVFRQIGESIAGRQDRSRPVEVATSSQTHRWVSFYANLGFPGAACPESGAMNNWEQAAADEAGFIRHLKQNNMRYVLWEQRRWPAGAADPANSLRDAGFVELGRWNHPDTGQMILYELR